MKRWNAKSKVHRNSKWNQKRPWNIRLKMKNIPEPRKNETFL